MAIAPKPRSRRLKAIVLLRQSAIVHIDPWSSGKMSVQCIALLKP